MAAKDDFDAVLKGLGLKVTPRRLAVLSVMSGASVFLSPEEIWKKVRKRVGSIGLPTVYRILEELASGGVVTRVLHDNRQLYYYLCTNPRHHHHFVCLSCHKVEDVDLCALDALEREVEQRIQGALVSHVLQLQGLCRDCCERREKA